MTDHTKRLAEIEARERAATKGPWGVDGGGDILAPGHPEDHDGRLLFESDPSNRYDPANSHFVVGAREDVPWLLGEYRAASEVLDAAGAPAGPLGERVRAIAAERDRLRAALRCVLKLTLGVQAIVDAIDPIPIDGDEPVRARPPGCDGRRPECCLTAALPDIGIVAAYGDTAQALAEDVASQVLFVVRTYALAAPETLAEDAVALRAKVRARLGLDGDPVVHENGTVFFEQIWSATPGALVTPEGQRLLHTMRGGLGSVPPEDVAWLIHYAMDAAMREEAIETVRVILRSLIEMPMTAMLAGLTSALPWADRLLEERAVLANAVRKANPEQAEELLRGLVDES